MFQLVTNILFASRAIVQLFPDNTGPDGAFHVNQPWIPAGHAAFADDVLGFDAEAVVFMPSGA